MQVQLTKPTLAKFVDHKVKAGEFPSAEAVIEDALLRMMESEETLTDEDLKVIEESRKQFERGEFVEFSEFAARMRAKYGIDE